MQFIQAFVFIRLPHGLDCLSAAVLQHSHDGVLGNIDIYPKSTSLWRKKNRPCKLLFSVLIIKLSEMFFLIACTESCGRANGERRKKSHWELYFWQNSPRGGLNAAFRTGRWLRYELGFALLHILGNWSVSTIHYRAPTRALDIATELRAPALTGTAWQ